MTRAAKSRIGIGLWVLALGGALSVAEPVLAKRKARAEDAGRPAVTFSGFHVFDNGSSRVFVNLTGQVPVEIHQTADSVACTLKGARLVSRNNRHPLITREFLSSVVSARLVPKERDVELLVKLREAVKPEHRVVARPDGSATLQVDFPAPTKKP